MNRLVWGALIAVMLAGGTACTDTEAQPGDAKPSAEAGRTARPKAAVVQSVPTPNPAERRELIDGLRSIDAGLVVNEDRAVNRSRATCHTFWHMRGEIGRAHV